ncbi:MAG: uroporphyrinogen decarboxylase family protein [Bacillota bacterium]|nr:uroporphyrinogen decarboxylase family protein [Bacillota bacterium]
MSKTPQELAKERVDRQMACFNLEVPDKVPLWGIGGDVVPEYSGITQQEFAYDYPKAIEAIRKYNADFQFDAPSGAISGLDGRVFNVAFSDDDRISPRVTFITGPMHDVLGDKYYKFPGNEVGENASPQFVGASFMDVDEYDDLIADPVDFIANTVLPRACTNLATPKQAMETWTQFGIEVERFGNAGKEVGKVFAELGYGSIPLGGAYTPLDIIGDFLRGITNTVLDLRRHPKKVKAAAEALFEPLFKYSMAYKKMGFEWVMIPLHLNEYLSPKLFNEFYWPLLRKMITELYREGIRSRVFFEGHHEPHLETILDLPKGWGVAYFEKTDIVKAKQVLKDNCCVAGGLPISLIVSGTPERIDAYIKELFEQVKPGGGFILSPSIGNAPEGTSLENIRAVIDAVEKYGYY